MLRKILLLFGVLFFFLVSCENSVQKAETDEPGDNDSSDSEIDDSDEIDDADSEKEPVFDLKVSANEKNFLSCRLSFSTPEAKKTFVKYYSPKNHAGYKTVEDSEKNEHYFFLWGMREDLDYKIEIYDEKTEELLATTEFHSGFLSASVIKPTLLINKKEFVQPGFVLFVQMDNTDVEMPPVMFMVDNDGFVVWYYEHLLPGFAFPSLPRYRKDTRTIFAAVQKGLNLKDIPSEEGIEIDLEGKLIWKSPEFENHYYADNGWHHEYRLLANDTILFIQATFQDEYMLYDSIVNVDRDYNELWRWTYTDSPDYFGTPVCANPDDVWCDWTHTNFANVFVDDSVLYFNSRFLGFYKMDMNTKEILWKFGEDGDFTMLSEHQFPWPDAPHAPEFFDETRKRVVFYDNGFMKRGFSRIIEYEIDEEAMTAEITFEYDGFDDGRPWWATAYGDVDYLENGNFLVTKGFAEPPENSSIFELTRDGDIVWELYTEQNDRFAVEIYRSEKFVPPLEFLK